MASAFATDAGFAGQLSGETEFLVGVLVVASFLDKPPAALRVTCQLQAQAGLVDTEMDILTIVRPIACHGYWTDFERLFRAVGAASLKDRGAGFCAVFSSI